MEFGLRVDLSRPYDRNLFPPSQDCRPIYDPCADCPWNYIGETGRYLQTRKNNILGTIKPTKTLQTLPLMHGQMATLFIDCSQPSVFSSFYLIV